jgi:glyoxylase-like metal-dependent hydrolase (beta-lactamase superfamily II)
VVLLAVTGRLKRMAQITEVARNTYLLDLGENPILGIPEKTYFLVDDVSVLIEPGSTTTASKLLTSSKELGLSLEDIAYIIPTHIHVDHGGGAGYLAQYLPQAKVVLHPKAVAHMIDPSRLIQGTRLVFGEDFEKVFGPILPVPESQIHIASEREVIQLVGRELRIFFSPGHASHHISIQDSLTEGLFCGEALGLLSANVPGVVLPAAAPPFDLELYLETIEKLRKLSPKLLFYSHDGVRSDVARLIKQVKENSLAFGNIIQSALEAGEDQQKILERLSEYVKGDFFKVELPGAFLISVLGYMDYFTNKK